MSFLPVGFTAADDMNHVRPDNTPNWTESYAFWAYWEDQYLYLHFQRHPDDSSMWRGYATVHGEDGSVLASHNFGREYSELGPGYSQIHCMCEKPFESFRAKIDTIAQVSDWKSLREKPLPSLDNNLVHLAADLQFASLSETYAPMQGVGGEHSNAKWTHFTPCKVVGYVTIGNERKFIDSFGWRDHSAGVRSFETMSSGFMYTGVFPSGKSFMAIGVGTEKENGESSYAGMGGVTIDGKLCYATEVDAPPLTSTFPIPHSDLGTFRMVTDHGESLIKMRTTNQGVPFALLPPCFESIGLPDGPKQRLVYHEWRLEVEWDGEVGIGGWEPCVFTP